MDLKHHKMVKTDAKVLGVLGGLGPAASVYFYDMLTTHTAAARDQDHLDIILSSRATTPDRTAYIVGDSDENPLDMMTEDAKRLQQFGADILVMPCNTAHYFYDSLRRAVSIPFINIIEVTVRQCVRQGAKKVGILATNGTIETMSYQRVCRKMGVACAIPSSKGQGIVMDIIYNYVKKAKPVNREAFDTAANELRQAGCDCIILGCTELSLVKKQEKLDEYFVDSLEVLAYESIKSCGKVPIGFPFSKD